jgi:hypothetical protein
MCSTERINGLAVTHLGPHCGKCPGFRVRLTEKSALFAVDVPLFGMLTAVPMFPIVLCRRWVGFALQVEGCHVAGGGLSCRRWRENASQVLVFSPTGDGNRPSVRSGVAGRPFFGDLRQYGALPATVRGLTCDTSATDLQRHTKETTETMPPLTCNGTQRKPPKRCRHRPVIHRPLTCDSTQHYWRLYG